jgi:hypothetical protein
MLLYPDTRFAFRHFVSLVMGWNGLLVNSILALFGNRLTAKALTIDFRWSMGIVFATLGLLYLHFQHPGRENNVAMSRRITPVSHNAVAATARQMRPR